MDSEKTLLDWLLGPLLLLIVITPLRFALEAAGIRPSVTEFFSSTVFVYLLSAYLGYAMAGRIKSPFSRLLITGFALGYTNGLMTLIATVLSTYASIETHYRHRSMNMSDAQHVFLKHVLEAPLLTSIVALLIAMFSFVVAGRFKRRRKAPETFPESSS